MSIKSLVLDALAARLHLRRGGGLAPLIFPNLDGMNPPVRNLLINGDMHFWQRGTGSVSVTTAQQYRADRWIFRAGGGSASMLTQRSASVPPNGQFKYSARMLENGDASANTMLMAQRIEASMIRAYVGCVMNASVWVRNDSVSPGWNLKVILPISEDNWNADVSSDTVHVSKNFPAGTVPAVGSAWQRLDLTFTVPAAAVSGMGIMLNSDSYNGVAGSSPDVYVTGFMLVEGKNPPPNFVRAGASYQQELALCQRFYEKSYSADVSPGTATNTGVFSSVQIADSTSTTFGVFIPFKTPKRNSPTMTFYNAGNGNSGSWQGASPADSNVTPAATQIGDNGFLAFISGGWTLSVDDPVVVFGHWTADIEL